MRIYVTQVLSVLLLAGCSAPQVISFMGSDVNPKSYLTYGVEHPKKTGVGGDQNARSAKVQEAIDLNMKSLDYSPASIPDIIVKYNLILSNTTDLRIDDPNRFGTVNRNPNPYYTVYSNEYTEGTLLVEIRETYSNKLVWQASMDLKYKPRRNSRSNKSKRIEDPLELAFSTVFAEYPYRAGSDVIVKPEEER